MNTHKACVLLSDQDILRAVLPHATAKRLARLMGAPLETARCWLYRNLSASRRQEIARALLAELDAEDARRALLREHLVRMVGEDGVGAVGGVTGSENSRQRSGNRAGAKAR